jgi:hypothetical protein
MIHRVIFLEGPYFHSLLCVGTSKSTIPKAMADIWGKPWKNQNCIKTRAYLANKRLSIYSQDKCREFQFFSNFKFLGLLSFELLGFENPRSGWT